MVLLGDEVGWAGAHQTRRSNMSGPTGLGTSITCGNTYVWSPAASPPEAGRGGRGFTGERIATFARRGGSSRRHAGERAPRAGGDAWNLRSIGGARTGGTLRRPGHVATTSGNGPVTAADRSAACRNPECRWAIPALTRAAGCKMVGPGDAQVRHPRTGRVAPGHGATLRRRAAAGLLARRPPRACERGDLDGPARRGPLGLRTLRRFDQAGADGGSAPAAH